MTPAPKSPTVTREDRELFINLFGIPKSRQDRVLNGSEDSRFELQAIAHHRLAASTPGAGETRYRAAVGVILGLAEQRKGTKADLTTALSVIDSMARRELDAPSLLHGPPPAVERLADAPDSFYGKVGIAMFEADIAGLRIDQAINFVGNAAFAAMTPPAAVKRGEVAREEIVSAISEGLREWTIEHSGGVITSGMKREMAECILRQPAILSALSRDGGKV